MSVGTIDVELDRALAALIGYAGRGGVGLEQLWRAAIAVDPELASSVDRRQRLADSLERLAAAGAVRPPSRARRDLDTTALPPLPLTVRAISTPAPARPARPVLPADLRPELAAARSLERPRADEIATLVGVNEFLRDFDPGRPSVPVRERSFEIFGDEKRLDTLVSQRLFTTGMLSLELLRCYVVHPPFVYQRISTDPTALLIENHHTYDSARRVLARSPRGIGVVGYGAGRAFCASVTYLADLDPAIERAYYFGDLDAPGLSIAAGADSAGRAAGTPPVLPATGLYRALLASPRRRGGTAIGGLIAEGLVAWLPAELRQAAAALLESGHWLPQEAVGLEVLTGLADWL